MTRAGILALRAADSRDLPRLPQGGPAVTTFGRFGDSARNGAAALPGAITRRGRLIAPAAAIVTQPLPGGGGDFGPDLGPANGQPDAE